jgi:hypothetical protein
MQQQFRQSFKPTLETLESRLTPAGAITSSFANGTWTLTGDVAANSIAINPTGTAKKFTVVGLDGESFTGAMTRGNVENIVINLGDGADTVRVNNTANPMTLAGKLIIHGGDGSNYVRIDRVTVKKSLKITNGTADPGNNHEVYLSDSKVSGNVSATSLAGDTIFTAYQDDVASSIGGNLIVTNGDGRDRVDIIDTPIGGDVVVHNGHGDAFGQAGRFWMFNSENTTSRSVVSGSIKVTNLTGEVSYNGIWDTVVKGNVTFDHGSGPAAVHFDDYSLPLPVRIRGNLTIRGTGATYVETGISQELLQGLSVGKNLSITTGDAADMLVLHQLEVGLATTIKTGGGADEITIDDSVFHGPLPSVKPVSFLLETGAGNDLVRLDTSDGTAGVVAFERVAQIDLGLHDDTLTLGFTGDAAREVQHAKKLTLLGNDGTDTLDDLNLVAIGSALEVISGFEP